MENMTQFQRDAQSGWIAAHSNLARIYRKQSTESEMMQAERELEIATENYYLAFPDDRPSTPLPTDSDSDEKN